MKIVCFGDSLTACGGENGRFSDILQERFPTHAFVNKGAGGDTFADAMERLSSDVLDEHADVVLLELGAVDWWLDERPPAAWAEDLETCITQIQDGGARCVVLGVFGDCLDGDRRVPKKQGTDLRGVEYRELEQAAAERHGCLYHANIQERIMGDRFCWLDTNHPNEYGNRYVADTIEPLLSELLGDTPVLSRPPALNTLADIWAEAVERAPAAAAVCDGDRALTYAEADSMIARLAAGFAGCAKSKSPKVAVYLPNCLEYFLVYWATVRLGGVVVPLNTWLKGDSLRAIIESVTPDLLIVRGPADSDVIEVAVVAGVTTVAIEAEAGVIPFDDLLKSDAPTPTPDISADAVAIILHTSGTTAAPKGAVMRHSDLIFNVMTTINAHQFAPSDTHLIVNPMFHATSLYSCLPTAAYQQARLVITAETGPESLLALVEREAITTFLSVPAVLQRVAAMADAERFDCTSLRLIGYAGAPMPVPTIDELARRFPGVDLHNFFGLTETISMTHVLTGAEADERPDSIGRLLPFVVAIVVDEDNRELPPGETGELLFDRANVITKYINQPGRLDEALCHIGGREWFRTGDLAMMDSDGFFFIRGRKKDMIIVGGENVYAAEVEAVLVSHPDVLEAAVRGVPATGVRESLGELIKAVVVARSGCTLTESDVRRHCHERLPSYKIPHQVVFTDELPRNPGGKVMKDEL